MHVARGPSQRPQYARYPAKRTQSSTSMAQRRHLHFRPNLQWVWCNRTPRVICHVSWGSDQGMRRQWLTTDRQPAEAHVPRPAVDCAGLGGSWCLSQQSCLRLVRSGNILSHTCYGHFRWLRRQCRNKVHHNSAENRDASTRCMLVVDYVRL